MKSSKMLRIDNQIKIRLCCFIITKNQLTQNIVQKESLKQKMIKQVEETKLTFLRHAQSLSNKAVHDFRMQRNLPECWKTFRSIDDFYHKVIYNPDLCDSGVSPKGEQQCLQAKSKLQDLQIDLILVSPLQRALQTCQHVFGQKFEKVDIIVEPLLAESIKYSSDISKRVNLKEKKFPKYNFQRVKKEGDYWFLKNDSQENQALYFEHLQAFPHHSFEQKQKQITKFMYLKRLRQSNSNLRERVVRIKELLKEYSKKYRNIVIVSHYYTIKHILAKKISANGQPLDEFHGPNCAIYKKTMEDLIEQKEQEHNY